jgi:zinc finger protein
MLLTDIPFFRSVIISSFSCEFCYLRNTEVQSSGALCEFGCAIKLKVTSKEDLKRDIVRGEWATTYLPELELTIPCTNKGYMSTLEGFLSSFRDDLQLSQPQRRLQNPEYADKIDEFIHKLNKYIAMEDDILPFTFRLVDPSGSSFIQNLKAPEPDPNLVIEKFTRTADQLKVP